METNVETFITENPDWYVEDGMLVAGFEFISFGIVQEKALAIMKVMEEADHHPELRVGYNTIEIRSVTHDAGNKITEKDIEIAKSISALME